MPEVYNECTEKYKEGKIKSFIRKLLGLKDIETKINQQLMRNAYEDSLKSGIILNSNISNTNADIWKISGWKKSGGNIGLCLDEFKFKVDNDSYAGYSITFNYFRIDKKDLLGVIEKLEVDL